MPAGLARPSSNPAHSALYGVKPDAIQGRVALNGRGQPLALKGMPWVLIDSLGGGPMMSDELALMPRSNALAGVNPALGVSVGSRQLTLSLGQHQLKKPQKSVAINALIPPSTA